jgi:hypothetical protein
MKRLLALVAVLAVVGSTAFAFQGTVLVSPVTATWQFFGIGKLVTVPFVGWKIGVVPTTDDFLEFVLPPGCLEWSGTATDKSWKQSDNWYLVTLSGGIYRADPVQAGVISWGYVPLSSDSQMLRFRLIDDPRNSFFQTGKDWYVVRTATPPTNGVGTTGKPPVDLWVCACPPVKDYMLTVNDWANFLLSPTLVDSATLKILTICDEWCYEFTSVSEKDIDRNDARVHFEGGNPLNSEAHFRVHDNDCAPDKAYWVTPNASDVFDIYITSDISLAGISKVTLMGVTTLAPAGGFTDPIHIQIPGNMMVFNSTEHFTIYVDGVTPLTPRTLSIKSFLFNPASKSGYCADREIGCCGAKPAADCNVGWIWSIDGTLFRSTWLAMARTAGYLSSARFSNENTFPVPVYVDVYMDDGNIYLGKYIGDVPARLSASWDLQNVVEGLGQVHNAAVFDAHSKGRITFFLWSENPYVFGLMFYLNTLGYGETPLEKLTFNGIFGYFWEK